MTHPQAPFDDIDSLVSRVKSLARTLESELENERADEGRHTLGVTPPPSAYRQRLAQALAAAGEGDEPKRLTLSRLYQPQADDETFLRGAYRQLLAREADPEGFDGYMQQLPRVGRLYVLADLLCASETRQSLARRRLEARWQRRLALPLRAAQKLGPLQRLVRLPLRLGYRLASIMLRPRLRLLARVDAMEQGNRRRDRLIPDVLLELDGQLGQLEAAWQRHLEQQNAEHERQQRERAALWSALQHHRRAVERLMEQPDVVASATPAAAEALSQSLFDAYYLAFEDACRGSEDAIRAHLGHYEPQWEAARQAGNKALDLGCGRGEWLALLAEQGFDTHGIDTNVAMVEHCRERGFSVTHTDAICALRELSDNSHALISAFHLAEHLPFDVLYTLVDEAQRVLAPGGVLILETPNPENVLVGSHTFYHDPTHLNPLTPTALEFLLGYHGFADVAIRRFNPYPEEAKVPGDDPLTQRVNGHLCGPQDFAAIGHKATPAGDDTASKDAHGEGGAA